MKLCIDIGNSQIYGGLFEGDELISRFRKITQRGASSDELGLFFRQVVRENGNDPGEIDAVGFCSVVPDLNHSLVNACRRYFDIDPFVLRAGVKSGLKIGYKNPAEVGADRIAGAVGAIARHPDRNIIIADFGTATTVEAVNSKREYLGGAIVPGLGISMRALEQNTARLPKVEIIRPDKACGRSTIGSIQSGLYWGHVGTVREICHRITLECFGASKPVIIGTGGFAGLLAEAGLFTEVQPDLVLEGIRITQELNA
ncbi:MAG: type III pantothenate kinase [Xanthomonadales bacterium]|nr:type III pantothenate kinase [Xanthomonadales bacterium]